MEVGEALPEIVTLSLLFILITSVEAGVFFCCFGGSLCQYFPCGSWSWSKQFQPRSSSDVTPLPVIVLALNELQLFSVFVSMSSEVVLLTLCALEEWLHGDSSNFRGLASLLFGRRPKWAHPWQCFQLLGRRSAVLPWPPHPATTPWGGASMTRFPEAPPGTDHWQPAAPSAPAKQRGLRPPLFPTERPSLFWTHASAERLGARPGQLSGVVL